MDGGIWATLQMLLSLGQYLSITRKGGNWQCTYLFSTSFPVSSNQGLYILCLRLTLNKISNYLILTAEWTKLNQIWETHRTISIQMQRGSKITSKLCTLCPCKIQGRDRSNVWINLVSSAYVPTFDTVLVEAAKRARRSGFEKKKKRKEKTWAK